MNIDDVLLAQERSIFIDKLEEARERAQEAPGEFLSEVASLVGAVFVRLPEERLEECLNSIETYEDADLSPLLRQSMRTIVPWVRAEVACARAIEADQYP